MKIQCEVCNKAEADVLCFADEAVLCGECDEKVHAANKLSQKHQRLAILKQPSSSSSQLPLCDICQERKGYFFCLQDRAMLCMHCDVSKHNASPYVSSHQRFFFGGVKVALQSSTNNSHIGCSSGNFQSSKSPNSSLSEFPWSEESRVTMAQDVQCASAEATAISGEPHWAADQHWSLDDIFNAAVLNNFEFPDVGPSKDY